MLCPRNPSGRFPNFCHYHPHHSLWTVGLLENTCQKHECTNLPHDTTRGRSSRTSSMSSTDWAILGTRYKILNSAADTCVSHNLPHSIDNLQQLLQLALTVNISTGHRYSIFYYTFLLQHYFRALNLNQWRHRTFFDVPKLNYKRDLFIYLLKNN